MARRSLSPIRSEERCRDLSLSRALTGPVPHSNRRGHSQSIEARDAPDIWSEMDSHHGSYGLDDRIGHLSLGVSSSRKDRHQWVASRNFDAIVIGAGQAGSATGKATDEGGDVSRCRRTPSVRRHMCEHVDAFRPKRWWLAPMSPTSRGVLTNTGFESAAASPPILKTVMLRVKGAIAETIADWCREGASKPRAVRSLHGTRPLPVGSTKLESVTRRCTRDRVFINVGGRASIPALPRPSTTFPSSRTAR